LVDEAKLTEGQSVFVAGAETALGAFAVQYAANVLGLLSCCCCAEKRNCCCSHTTHINIHVSIGAKVTAACPKAHVERSKTLGATTVVDIADQPAMQGARDHDIGFDPIGGELALWATKKGGVCVSAATHTPEALSVRYLLCVVVLCELK
jgi:NADPH:quinone reductase-like Zn-dependent oxidoreductase